MHRRKAKAFRRESRRRRPEGRESCWIKMKVMKNRRMIVMACGTVLLIVAAVVVALRERRQPLPSPEVPVAQTPADVRVKAVERKAELVEQGEIATASDAVAIVCGMDEATADRYEAQNAALRSITRRELTLALRVEL